MNQKDNREADDESKQTKSLADLPLTTEHAEETKAGDGFRAYGGFNGGVFVGSAD
jgi:hypothetical protein